MKVQDLVEHILHHVDAEDASRDSSQVAGVAGRAQYVRATLDGFRVDSRELSLDAALAEIADAASLSVLQVSFQNAIMNTRDGGDTRPQLVIQAWVGKAEERRGG